MCQKHVKHRGSNIWTIKKQYKTGSEENFEDVEIKVHSDDEAENEEYPQDKSVWPFKVPTLRF